MQNNNKTAPEQTGRRVLYIDDRVPHPALGAGFPRAHAILQTLIELGCAVTIFPTLTTDEKDDNTNLLKTVEVIQHSGKISLRQFLEERRGYYDVILVSRPHNMAEFQPILLQNEDWFEGVRIAYDAEAIFSQREIRKVEVAGKIISEAEKQKAYEEELSLTVGIDRLLCVSGADGAFFGGVDNEEIFVVSAPLEVAPTPASFAERDGCLFIGAFHNDDNPNTDAVTWFCREVWGQLENTTLTIAGLNRSPRVQKLASERIRLTGKVDDLTPLYNRARVFIAPHRYAAGIPYKICEAAARGVPVVATGLLANQLGWQAERDILVADTPLEFAAAVRRLLHDANLWQQVRDNALKRIEQDFSPTKFRETLKKALLD
jgi:O-antigen biosynthesis protein